MTDTELVQETTTKIWVLVIDHKHGTNVSAHPSRAALDDALYDYCDEWWEREYGAESRPADDELVAGYWERMAAGGEEWHVIEECEVPALAPAPHELNIVLESCKIEHTKFEEWAKGERYDMHEHPLHYLFLDPKTNAARQGWRAALGYVRDASPRPARETTARREAGFADAYEAARRVLPRDLMLDVVSRNALDDKMEKLYRPDNEPDDELARRIIATYLAVTAGP